MRHRIPPPPVGPFSKRVHRLAAVVAFALLVVAQAAQAKTFAWKATGKGGTIYLMGSIHVMSESFYPLDPALEAAFKDSDLLVEEVDLAQMLDPMAQMSILTRGMLPSNQSLDKVVSPATLALVQKATGDLGPSAGPLMRFKPWMLAITLQGMELMKAGFDPALGLDQHFYDQAKDGGKAVQGLETVEYQISRFDEMTMEQQDRMLAETLKELATETAMVGKLGDAWKAGDVATIERMALADIKSDPLMYQRLLVERNKNWMPKIEALFARPGKALVVVGAAHLVGPDGLIAMLKAKGYSIQQL
jgi:uncharacterized protein YbaP (TraB family)